jgi:hypothetical protein
MSYGYSYSMRRQVQAEPQRPLGVAIIATLGILSGLTYTVLVLFTAYLRMSAAFSLTSPAGYLIAGFGVSLFTIWFYWSLWDLLGWAWVFHILLNAVSVVAGVLGIAYAEPVAAFLAGVVPGGMATSPLQFGLISTAIIDMAFNLCIAIYLISVRKAFGIGVRRRPAWERPPSYARPSNHSGVPRRN